MRDRTRTITLAHVGRTTLWALVLLVGLTAIVLVVVELRVVVVAGVVAAMLASALEPVSRALADRRIRPGWSAATLWLVSVGAVVSLGSWVATQAWRAASGIGPAISAGISNIESWLQTGPLGISLTDIQNLAGRLGLVSSGGASSLVRGLAGGAGTVAELLEGVVLALVFAAYFLTRRDSYGDWILRAVPDEHRPRGRLVAVSAYEGLGSYARATAMSAGVNALVVFAVLATLGIPMAPSLSALAFMAGFFPVVGTITAGALAALVALAAKGFLAAVIMVIATAVLHHVEVYVVGPMIIGRVVRFHPAAQVAALAIGLAVAGVVGLFLAGPSLAVSITVVRALRQDPAPADVDE